MEIIDEGMIEDVLQMLYVASQFYGSDRWEKFTAILNEYTQSDDFQFDLENLSLLYSAAIDAVFETVKVYYKDETQRTTFVFWDPVMYRYNKLCREYEEKRGITEIENPYVNEMESAVHNALQLNSYSYTYLWTTDTKSPRGSKLVFIEDVEFECEWQLPGCLMELRTFYTEGVKRLEAELAPKDSKLIVLPAPKKARRRKEAA